MTKFNLYYLFYVLPLGTVLPVVINLGKPLSNTVANSDAHVSPLLQAKVPRKNYKNKFKTIS